MHIAAAHGNTDIGNLLYDSNAKLDAKDKVTMKGVLFKITRAVSKLTDR